MKLESLTLRYSRSGGRRRRPRSAFVVVRLTSLSRSCASTNHPPLYRLSEISHFFPTATIRLTPQVTPVYPLHSSYTNGKTTARWYGLPRCFVAGYAARCYPHLACWSRITTPYVSFIVNTLYQRRSFDHRLADGLGSSHILLISISPS